ncbi:uncharacterized protein LOC126971735 [Leptidea sinapis]|uniref:uncharacterized protein LOC126971735 n=1 Tax=Leptidea sinapis TaxID=189913 RepID=UPI0021C46017|nr:uncharacterized protein LOC126971735 [Leptidea sinapis]
MAAAHTLSVPAPAERRPEGRAGSRRIFPPQFKLQVLDAYRRDAQCRGNQRATARKFGIHRRQIQKWLQAEPALRAALLRRAPQPAPSPPPYSVGSPESARLPSPPPPLPVVTTTSPVQVLTGVAAPVPRAQSFIAEPIDLSVRRLSPPPAPIPSYAPATPVPPKKPFKLFRPYLMEDEDDKRASLACGRGGHVSAFVPVQSAAACSLPACSPCSLPACSPCSMPACSPCPPCPLPAYAAPLR